MFDLAYNVEDHGWATAVASNGNASVEMTVPYLSDALGDFARAVRGLLRGQHDATFSFLDEPGEHRFILTRDRESVQITLYWFGRDETKLHQGQVVLTAESTVANLATTTLNCLRNIRDTHGEAGYRDRWHNHDFPSKEYQDLLDLRRAMTAARQAGRRSTAADPPTNS